MDNNLIIIVLSSFKALAIVFLVFVLTMPLGLLFLRLTKLSHSPNSRLSLAFAIGFIFQFLLVFIIHYLELQDSAYKYSILALIPILSVIFIKISFTPTEKRLLGFIVIATIFYSHLLIFPGAENVSPDSARALNGYHTDNLISFNTARIFTEGLNIRETIVVPVWTFFDRTPVAGALVAYLWFFLGIKENAIWLASSGDNFYYYQVQMIFLNLLSLLSITGLFLQSSKKNLHILLLLLFSPFILINMSFAWPKFFSAFFVIAGLSLFDHVARENLKSNKELFFAGILLGLGYLVHDSAILFLITFFALFFVLIFFTKVIRARQYFIMLVGLLFVVSPWFIFKAIYETKSNHMYALHLFCIKDFSYQNLSFKESLLNYLSRYSYYEIFKIKLGNLFYPFSIVDFFKSLNGSYFNFVEWLKISAMLSKYQLVHALTFPVFLTSIFGLFKYRNKQELTWWFVVCGLASILPAAIIFGCERSSWNHTWVYVPILLLLLPLGKVFYKYRFLYYLCLLSCLMISTQLLVIQADFINKSSFVYLFWAVFLCLLQLNIIYFEKCSLD